MNEPPPTLLFYLRGISGAEGAVTCPSLYTSERPGVGLQGTWGDDYISKLL